MNLKIKDFRAIKDADIDISKIALLCGHNGAGKSAIIRAAGCAATGQPHFGILKKNAKDIVRDGMDKAFVQLKDTIVSYPKCEIESHGAPIVVSPVAAGFESYLDMDDKRRTEYLKEILKADVSKDDVMKALKEKGVAETTANAVWAMIEEQDWDAAHKRAKETGAKMKGQWELLTGESWGINKAASWTVDGLAINSDLPPEQQRQEYDHQIGMARNALEGAIRKQGADEHEVDRLKEEYRNLDHWTAVKKEAEEAKKEEEKTLKDLQGKRDAIPADVAGKHAHCPHCSKGIEIKTDLTLAKWEGETKSETKEKRMEAASLDGKIKNTQNKINILEKGLSEAASGIDAAIKAGDKLSKFELSKDNEQLIAQLRQEVIEKENQLKFFDNYMKVLEINKKLAVNIEITALLDKQGIRKRKVMDVVDGFNKSVLAPMCQKAGWSEVKIGQDLNPYYNQRIADERTGECSHAEELRTRYALQLAFATLDNSEMVLVDKADHLDPPGRSGLMKLLASWKKPAIVAMTMQEPSRVPPMDKMGIGQAYWIENGIAEKL